MPLPQFTTLGSGPTVLMLHGIGGGHLAFAPQVETLAQAGYRAVAWDMPGYGRSAPIEPYTFKGLAQSCVDLIDALQCEHVALLGHSMGGLIATLFALCIAPICLSFWTAMIGVALQTRHRLSRRQGNGVVGLLGLMQNAAQQLRTPHPHRAVARRHHRRGAAGARGHRLAAHRTHAPAVGGIDQPTAGWLAFHGAHPNRWGVADTRPSPPHPPCPLKPWASRPT